MHITESNAVINDAWRGLLVVTSDNQIPEFPNGIITNTDEHHETVYYTDGLFRSFYEGDKHINWYLIRSKEVKERAVAALQEENRQLKAEVLANKQSTAFLEDCLVEMAMVLYA